LEQLKESSEQLLLLYEELEKERTKLEIQKDDAMTELESAMVQIHDLKLKSDDLQVSSSSGGGGGGSSRSRRRRRWKRRRRRGGGGGGGVSARDGHIHDALNH